MEEILKETENISFQGKEKTSIPKGAEILKKDVRIEVEEIENGFIIRKSYDIKYKLGENVDWMYFCKKIYTKENPIEIKEDKMLADFFD